jgi:hypothetical protein
LSSATWIRRAPRYLRAIRQSALAKARRFRFDERAETLKRTVFPALLSDFLHFVCEALATSRKGKLTVTHALLRKPLQDSLFLLKVISTEVGRFAQQMTEGRSSSSPARHQGSTCTRAGSAQPSRCSGRRTGSTPTSSRDSGTTRPAGIASREALTTPPPVHGERTHPHGAAQPELHLLRLGREAHAVALPLRAATVPPRLRKAARRERLRRLRADGSDVPGRHGEARRGRHPPVGAQHRERLPARRDRAVRRGDPIPARARVHRGRLPRAGTRGLAAHARSGSYPGGSQVRTRLGNAGYAAAGVALRAERAWRNRRRRRRAVHARNAQDLQKGLASMPPARR